MAKEISYCGQMVRDHDPDRFLLSMLVPAEHRAALWALFAFNYEIAKTREVVSETQLGLIRLQWWRGEIEKIYKGEGVPEGEVLCALAKVIQSYDLPCEHFETLICAREFDLEDVLPANLEGLLNYADFTTTPLMKMVVQIMGGDPDVEPSQSVAVNYALAGLLRAVPRCAQQRHCFLPEDLLNMQDVKLSQLYELKPEPALCRVIEAVSGEIIAGIQSDNRFLHLSQALALIYAKQLKKLNYNVFHPKASLAPAFKVLRLMMAS